MNTRIVDGLKNVLKYKQIAKEKKSKFSLLAIQRAIDTISGLDFEITIGNVNSLTKMKIGIGKGIVDRIKYLFTHGQMEEEYKLLRLNPELDAERRINEQIKDLCRIIGIGESKARYFISQFGITSVDEMKKAWLDGRIREEKNQLTHAMIIGLKYLEHIEKRIPRSEIHIVNEYIANFFKQIDPKLRFEISGSYRRGCETSGDIDILISHPELKTKEMIAMYQITASNGKVMGYFDYIIGVLKSSYFLIDDLTNDGKTKYMGMCTIDGQHFRRIDIRFIPAQSWATALMYFTGSKDFNVRFRTECLKRGYTLNEDGLYEFKNKIKGKCVSTEFETEEDIFKFFGFAYVPPTERNY